MLDIWSLRGWRYKVGYRPGCGYCAALSSDNPTSHGWCLGGPYPLSPLFDTREHLYKWLIRAGYVRVDTILDDLIDGYQRLEDAGADIHDMEIVCGNGHIYIMQPISTELS